jgi:hypothetical protein
MSLRGTALITEAEPLGNPDKSVSNVLDVATDFFRSRAYRFALEVRLEGRRPYVVEGTWKVPAKAEQTGPLRSGGSTLPPGVEVPVEVDESDTTDVDIDWDAYVALPDRKKTQKRLYQEYRAAKTAAYVEQHRSPAHDRAEARAREAHQLTPDKSALQDGQRLYALGITRSATVVSAADTGRTVSRVPIWRFELGLDDGRRVSLEQAVPRRSLKRYTAGSDITVYTDPDDPDAFALG